MRDTTSNIILLFSGILVGAAAAIVFAPESGRATRRKLSDKAEDAGEFVSHSGRDYLEKGRELYDMGRQLAENAAQMFDDGRQMMEGDPNVARSK